MEYEVGVALAATRAIVYGRRGRCARRAVGERAAAGVTRGAERAPAAPRRPPELAHSIKRPRDKMHSLFLHCSTFFVLKNMRCRRCCDLLR
ncbi:unnamed protein product [Colias eurytheme]|nr:unnamed protein product [Colias eurytheme]